jgi:glycosyltransferase involved in cell wall biosynthesis
MVPFGSPVQVFGEQKENEPADNNDKRPLRVLFAGSMSQRKGLGDLFAAVRLLNRRDIELVVMGSSEAPMEFYRKQYPDFIYEPGRPNDQVLALMRTCDVFCLPSIVEGRALVMQEAMSQGLPIIITANTGGEDLVKEDGSTGFLVPIRSPQLIAEKLNWMLDNRAETKEMGKKAKQHAAEYTWKKYGDNIIDAIRDYIH